MKVIKGDSVIFPTWRYFENVGCKQYGGAIVPDSKYVILQYNQNDNLVPAGGENKTGSYFNSGLSMAIKSTFQQVAIPTAISFSAELLFRTTTTALTIVSIDPDSFTVESLELADSGFYTLNIKKLEGTTIKTIITKQIEVI